MYHVIRFYHDENGKALRDDKGKAAPRILTPEMVYAKEFSVSINADSRTGAQQLRVERIPGPLSKDGWNDDGRPPTVLFFIEFASISMNDGVITAVGMENPNLTVAGLVSESYDVRSSKKRWSDPSPSPIADLVGNRRTSMDNHPWTPISDFTDVYPQKVTLLPKRNS